MLKNVLLTGAAGVGKTTLIKTAVRRLGERAGGFFTEEIREGKTLIGFHLVTLDGREATAAEGELEEALQTVAAPALEAAQENKDVIVVDEIGLMEVGSGVFVQALQACLDSAKPVLGCIGRQDHPVLQAIRNRADTLVIEVTKQNREYLLERVFSGLRLPTESFAETERNIAKKRLKAERYAGEKRLAITGLTGRFTSDHHVYEVAYENGQWHCGCSFFLKYGTCSHTMASAKMLSERLAAAEKVR